MRTQRPFADVRSCIAWRVLTQPAAKSLLLFALCGCGAVAEGDDASLDPATDSTGEAGLETTARAITHGDLVPGNFKEVVKIDGTCTATKLKGVNKLLTAAHCILNELAQTMKVSTNNEGTNDANPLHVQSILIHPSFKLRTLPDSDDPFPNSQEVYDIAVVSFASTDTNVSSITGLSLPSNETPPTNPTTATSYGFGCDDDDASRAMASKHGGKRQSGFFNLSGTLDHDLTSSGPDVVCEGDSGGPLLSNTDASIIGVVDAGSSTRSYWSRTGNVRNWILNATRGNDASLFANSNFLFFMTNRKVNNDGKGARSLGLCMVANSNVLNPATPTSVILGRCSDPIGHLTQQGSGWTSLSTTPAGRFVIFNRATGQCLQPNGAASGADLQAVTCNIGSPTPSQKWTYTTASRGGIYPTLRIKNDSTGMCISTEGGGTAAGSKVEQATCDNGADDSVQSWVATR